MAAGIVAIAPVALVGTGEIDAGTVLHLVSRDDSIAVVVMGLADQPTEDTFRFFRICDARMGVLTVDREVAIAGRGALMHEAVYQACPASSTGKEVLYTLPGAVSLGRETGILLRGVPTTPRHPERAPIQVLCQHRGETRPTMLASCSTGSVRCLSAAHLSAG